MKDRRSVITGVGKYLPARILTNRELEQRIDTTDQWIRERTGIEQRHVAAENELTSDLAAKAGQAALEDAGVDPESVDLVIVATCTPDKTMPATAPIVQGALGLSQAAAFDLQAVCSGFLYALTTADSFLRAGQANRVLVIGAEVISRLLDWEDRSTCILMGDGAGAVMLEATEGEPARGMLSAQLYTDGTLHSLIQTDGGIASTGAAGHFRMEGKEVYRQAVGKMAGAVETLLAEQGLAAEDIGLLIPHQANWRIMKSIAKRLKLNDSQVVSTVARHANTSAASIPLALAQAKEDNRLNKGDLIAFTALGSGLTWGAALLRW